VRPLAIRADANAAIGAGHVMRSIALADAWRRAGGDVLLFTVAPPRFACDAAARRGLTVRTHESADAAKNALIAWARENAGAWVAFDSYEPGGDAHRSIRAAGARLLVVDDCAAGAEFDCDILLNQNIGADALGYRLAPGTRTCFGPRFALLRGEFLNLHRDRQFDVPASRIVITFGGADVHNQAARVAAIVAALPAPLDATVVTGQAHPHEASEIAPREGVRIRWQAPTDDMAPLLAQADLAICAAGSTCWELAHLGVPALTLVVAANQMGVAAGLHDAGVIRSLGWFDHVSDTDVALAIETLRRDDRRAEMSRRGRALVDGRGADRVVEAMTRAASSRGTVALRRATMADAAALYRWRIDSETVRNSIAPPPASIDDHRAWLETALRNPHLALYVATDGARHVDIGSVRIDRRNDGEAEISITVDPDERGRGYSHDLIASGLEAAGDVRVVARVKRANDRSLRAFRALGFRVGDTAADDLLWLVHEPVRAARGVHA
jgi:UDP-2,4-diacetamido-2,4,6-trideoxy-beta-L-altropyranose hydrolase